MAVTPTTPTTPAKEAARAATELLDFDGQVVLVTGAGAGIGAAVAEGFAALGANVVVHYRGNADGAEKVAAGIGERGGRARTVQADLSTIDACHALVADVLEHEGRLDVLVNNAGDLVGRSSIADAPEELYRSIMDVNVTSMFGMCQAALPHLTERCSGSIVNLTSIAARTGGAGDSVLYASSKGAVSTFTRGLAKEVATTGVRVNALAPGVIVTPFHERNSSPEMMESMQGQVPMGRLGEPAECVGAVVFLASDAMAGYVTGQILEVNGGQYMP